MIFTIAQLLAGNDQVFTYYQLAKKRWEAILNQEGYRDIASLSKKLSDEQIWFEHNCGGRTLGQEIMAITGIAQFYDIHIGFDKTNDKAMFVYEAFARSYCSLEVKYYASDTAKEYGLIERGRHDF
ncbi:MAG: hypothetical protein AB1521_11020 [Bacteroidota bacterium]